MGGSSSSGIGGHIRVSRGHAALACAAFFSTLPLRPRVVPAP